MKIFRFIKIIFASLYLNTLLNLECSRIGIKKKPFLRFRFNMKSCGSANRRLNRIIISLSQPIAEWHSTLLHELRHIWQFENYGDIVDWCQKYLSPYNKSDEKYYFLDPLEMDAYFFEQRKGKMFKSFISDLNIDILNDMHKKDIFFNCMTQIIYYYHIHVCEQYLQDTFSATSHNIL